MAKALPLLALVLVAIVSNAQGKSHQYSSLVLFGDSVTDTGNFLQGTGGRFPLPSVYFQGRFTNSPGVWVDHIHNMYPTLAIHNFATGGAPACPYDANVTNALPALLQVPNVEQQVATYLSRVQQGQYPKPKYNLPVFWAGANDILVAGLLSPEAAQALPARIAGCLSNYVSQLLDSPNPPKTVVVANMAPLDNIPQALLTNTTQALAALSGAANATITQAIEALRSKYPTANIVIWNINSLLLDLDVNFAQWGFKSNSSCLTVTANFSSLAGDQPTARCTPGTEDSFVFYDAVHPTSRVHNLFAKNLVMALKEYKVKLGSKQNTGNRNTRSTYRGPAGRSNMQG